MKLTYKNCAFVLSGLLAVSLGLIAYLQTLSSHQTIWNDLCSGIFGSMFIFGGTVALSRVKRLPSGGVHKAFTMLAVSLLCQGLGLLMWSFYNVVFNIDVPFPSPITIFFALQTLLVALGLWTYEDSVSHEEGYEFPWISAAPIIVFASLMIVVILSRSDLSAGLSFWEKVFNTMGMLSHGFIVSLGIALVLNKRLRSLGLVLFVTGMALLAVGNIIFFYQVAKSEFWNGSMADVMLSISGYVYSLGMIKLLDEKRALN